ncbi:hypothetical protein [Undibacterium sp. Ji22W]|uniref:hypothetical protein n=1 Tax=Undibacterium sp. Ji22W TaxID=3413038 RepID=UPI003BF42171
MRVIVRAMDAAGNTAQRLFNFTFDTAAPIAPSVSLATDSGTSSSDKLTNAVTLNSITEAGATVTYSSDGGVNWTEIYTPGADGAKTVLVRSTDKAGNTSQNSVVSFTLDTKTTVPSVVLTNDTGNSNGDRISRDVTLSTTNVEAGASLSYSLDGGLSFTNNLVPKQGANSIIVRSTDLAGNSAQANPIVITYDSIVPVMSSSRITYNNQGTKFDATDDEWSLEFEDATSLSIDPSLLQITNVTRSSSILPTSATFVGNTLKIKASALPSNWYFGDAIDFSFASGAIRDLAGNVSAAIPITGNFDTVSLNAKVAVVNIAAGQTYQGVAGWNDQFTGSLENLVGTTINGDSGDKETVTLTTAGTFRINHGWMPAGFLRNISTLNLANGNNDIFYSGDAVDAYLRGAHGVREINGGTGNDLISSAFFPAGTSIKLTGGAGDDLLNVDAGTEIVAATLEGGDGNDTLRTNLIAEPVINGGNGIDTFVLFNNSGSSVTVTDANFAKVSQIEKFNLSLISESVSYITLGKNANAAFANGLTFMTPTIVNFNGAALTVPSTIDGSNSNDVIVTGSGNDQIFGGPGADTLNGGAGNDIFRYFYSVDSLWSGFDTVFVNAGDKLSGIYGSSGIIKVTSGTQVTTDLITVTDFVNALQEKIKTGTGAIGGVYYLSITDSQQTAGVNYSGTYIVQTVTGEPSKIDSFDTVIKLIGAAGVSVVGADLLIL